MTRVPGEAERRALQATVALLSLVPLSAGLAGVLTGGDFLGLPPPDGAGPARDLDSHLRYLSGIFLGVGVAFLSTVPRIERQGPRFRLLTLFVVLGGVARALSLALHGAPTPPHLVGLVLELVVVPALALWQARVARRAARP